MDNPPDGGGSSGAANNAAVVEDVQRARAMAPAPAEQRAAPGDTSKELAGLLKAFVTEDAEGQPGRQPPSTAAGKVAREELEVPVETTGAQGDADQEQQTRRARPPVASTAERRAAPGDTLKEELAQMCLGTDSPR